MERQGPVRRELAGDRLYVRFQLLLGPFEPLPSVRLAYPAGPYAIDRNSQSVRIPPLPVEPDRSIELTHGLGYGSHVEGGGRPVYASTPGPHRYGRPALRRCRWPPSLPSALEQACRTASV